MAFELSPMFRREVGVAQGQVLRTHQGFKGLGVVLVSFEGVDSGQVVGGTMGQRTEPETRNRGGGIRSMYQKSE